MREDIQKLYVFVLVGLFLLLKILQMIKAKKFAFVRSALLGIWATNVKNLLQESL